MESRLPKPSGLKRPMPSSSTTTIVPMNRIKREPTASVLNHKTFANIKPISTTEPYKDLTNLLDIRGKQMRALSPDPRGTVQPRFKIRRSRSACDILALKKAENVQAKMPRLNEFPTSNGRLADRFGGGGLNAKKTTTTAAAVNKSIFNVKTGATAKRTPFAAAATQQPIVKPFAKKEPPKKTTTGGLATSTSTTGAAKPINKRIPPYDFKARYHDLLEKHKTLKEKHQQTVEQLENFENLPDQYEECKSVLETTKQQLEVTTTENASLHQNVSILNLKIESITTNFEKCKEALTVLKENYNSLNTKHKALCEESQAFKETNEKLLNENKYFSEELNVCREQLFRANMERKILHNELMDMRGNIRVFCRVRPPLPTELEKSLCGWNYIDEATVEIVNHDLLSKNKQGAHTFQFDHVFHPGSLQEDVFLSVSPLIQSAMDGFNICIFAYGQTGSGKTFTMDGIETKPGVIPRTVDLLFNSVEGYKHLGWEYTIKVTFLEIYNEVLYDLLSNEQKDMEIRMATSNKNDIYVSNITEEIVETAAQLRQLMAIAKMNRATAATTGNERSSRSHAVTKIELCGYHAEKNEYSVGTINLVDLAGSESPKTSQRMTETKNINRSLSELTNVILALLQKQDHIPYRNSKLTHLLMPSLGGNSKTLMFINVAPFFDCYVESVKSLRFAASVNSCKLAKAKRNRFLNTSTPTTATNSM